MQRIKATLVLAMVTLLLVPGVAAGAQVLPPPETAERASACGGFPNPDFVAPYTPPIYDYMSFRSWFVHQPGATIVGQLYVPIDRVAWPYRGTDTIVYTPEGMKSYSQTVEGGNTVGAYYDPRTGVAGVLERCATATIYVLFKPKDVPIGLPTFDIASQATAKGVTLGMSSDQVKTLIGPSDSYHTQHIDDYLLYQWQKPSNCKRCPPDRFAMKLDFENDRLIAMSYSVWLHPTIQWTRLGAPR